MDINKIERTLKEIGRDLSVLTGHCYAYFPTRIQKNGPATIVFWEDGTKTIVKRSEGEPDSDYAAFTAALGIKVYGSNSALKRIVERTETQEPKKKREPQKEQKAHCYVQCPDCKAVMDEYIYPANLKDLAFCPNCGRCVSEVK